MENMLSSRPDLDAIYSISDTQTFGAVKAIDKSNVDQFTADQRRLP